MQRQLWNQNKFAMEVEYVLLNPEDLSKHHLTVKRGGKKLKDLELVPVNEVVTITGFEKSLVEDTLFEYLKEQSQQDPDFNFVSYYKKGRYKKNNAIPPNKLFIGMLIEKETKTEVHKGGWIPRQSFWRDNTCFSVCSWEERTIKTSRFTKLNYYLHAIVLVIPQFFKGTVSAMPSVHSNLAFRKIGLLEEGQWELSEAEEKIEKRNSRCVTRAHNGGICP